METYEPFINAARLAKTCPLDNGDRQFKQPIVALHTEGWESCRLQALPNECLEGCLQYLDLQTLTTLRSVSQYMRIRVDSLLPYSQLYEHAPQAIRACLSTGAAARITLLRLFHSLTSMECYYCRTADIPTTRFGSYLSLFEGRRACLFCVWNNPALFVIDLATAIRICSFRNPCIGNIKDAQKLRTLPEAYGPDVTMIYRTGSLVRSVSIPTMPNTSMPDRDKRIVYGSTLAGEVYHHPLVKRAAESEIGPDRDISSHSKEHYRYQTAIKMPYLTRTKSIQDFGTLCVDCNLHMQFEERRWQTDQENRRQNFQTATASLHRRGLINKARRLACTEFSSSEETRQEIGLGRESLVERNSDPCLSIQEHTQVHSTDTLSMEEFNFRKTLSGERNEG